MKQSSTTSFSRSIALLAALAIISACGASIPNYDYSKEPDPRQTEYVLGVSDSVDINVWEEDKLSTKATIRPDGMITIKLIGDIRAVGMTATELEAELKKKLRKFVEGEREITVSVTGWSSYRFTVTGEVNQSGVYSSDHFVTIDEAVALAGGLTRFAKKDEMVLMRRDAKTGTVRRIPIAYSVIADGSRPDMNLALIRDDVLHVP